MDNSYEWSAQQLDPSGKNCPLFFGREWFMVDDGKRILPVCIEERCAFWRELKVSGKEKAIRVCGMTVKFDPEKDKLREI
ncbi:MAG: hypothetical protein OHK0011_00900 [Turneriella sp.]